MLEVEDFIYSQTTNQKEILLFLHDILTIELGLSAKIRYRVPFYFGQSWICYCNPIKNDGIELALLRGNELSNSLSIFESKDRKMVIGLSIYELKDFPKQLVIENLLEAIQLDETIPYRGMNKKKG